MKVEYNQAIKGISSFYCVQETNFTRRLWLLEWSISVKTDHGWHCSVFSNHSCYHI